MAMLETGKVLPTVFKEMGTGGLGITMVDCYPKPSAFSCRYATADYRIAPVVVLTVYTEILLSLSFVT
jgi:hypothetical protein